jgi:hypothetical protein
MGILFQVIFVERRVTFECDNSSANRDGDLYVLVQDDVYTLRFGKLRRANFHYYRL